MGAGVRPRASAPLALTATAGTAAILVGFVLGASVPKGLAVLVGLAYLPLVVYNLRLATAFYVVLVFIAGTSLTGKGPTIAGLLVLMAWAGALRERSEALRSHRLVTPCLIAFALWLALSSTWASKPSAVLSLLFPQYLVAFLAFVVVATFVRTERDHVMIVAGFLGGAVLSVVIAFAQNGLVTAQTAVQTASQLDQGRLATATGDPNYLAAGLIPALVIGAGLLGRIRDPVARLVLIFGMALLPAGLAATQSRGGLVATALTVLAALVLARGYRAQVLAFVIALAACAGVWLAANPAAAQRIVNFNDGGAGRSDLWHVGWEMFKDHPVKGVGLDNFQVLAPQYTRRAGELQYVELVAENPHVTHNVYLQFLAETGVIGLGLFLALVGGCVGAALSAARRFAAQGRRRMELHARLTVIAQLGFLAASFFLSDGPDERMWILLALGPGLMTIARRTVPRGVAT